jgi:hypothetical protein
MRTWKPTIATLTFASLVMMAGCGGGSGAGGSAGVGGTTSTVSGNISNQSSTAMRMTASPTLLARVVRFFSPVTDAIAAVTGIQVTTNGVGTNTDPSGFFALSGPFSGLLNVLFNNGSQSFSVPINVPPGATVVLRDINLAADGTAQPGQMDVYLHGIIASASCSSTPETLTVAFPGGTKTVDLDGNTKIRVSGNTTAATCQDLNTNAGQPVRVEAETQGDGSLLAERVKVRPEEADEAAEVGFRGAVTATSCPDSITVQRTDGESVTVKLTSSTVFEGATGCSNLSTNEHVKVQGTLATDGTVTAGHVEVEDEQEMGREGHPFWMMPWPFLGFSFPTPTPTTATASPTPTP